MSSGDSDECLQLADVYGCLTVDALARLTGDKSNTATKKLAERSDLGRLVKVPFIHPRCLWRPPNRYFGTQKLILMTQILFRCVQAEPRIWTPCERQGSATIIQCGDEKEALTVDYGATPRFLARKLACWCEGHDISEIAALGVVVPTVAKAEAINRAATNLPLPINFVVSKDLCILTGGRRA